MKFIHTADLHLGKKLADFPLLPDQRHFLLDVLLLAAKKAKAEAILLSGDIYDTTSPGQAAITLLDEFLTACADSKIKVLLIPGNHDSAEKLSFLSQLVRKDGLYFVTELADAEKPIEIGGVNFYCLPFLRHYDVNREYGAETKSTEEAVRFMIEKMAIDRSRPNVILAHQTVFPAGKEETLERSGSEEPSVGAQPNVASEVFSAFDYVALGHIHKPQKVGANAYYSGSPLAYHSDEANRDKFFNLVTMEGKAVTVSRWQIAPLHRVRKITGRWSELLSLEPSDDYVFLELQEESRIDNAMAKARAIFPNCCAITYEESPVAASREDIPLPAGFDKNDPLRDLAAFYRLVAGEELSQQQEQIAKDVFAELAKGEEE